MTGPEKRALAILKRKRKEAEEWLELGENELVAALAYGDRMRCDQLWELINSSNELLAKYDRCIAIAES